MQGTPPPVGGSVWPRPNTIVDPSRQVFLVDTVNFVIQTVNGSGIPIVCPDLEWAKNHYTQLIRNLRPNGTTEGELKELEILVGNCSVGSLENVEETCECQA